MNLIIFIQLLLNLLHLTLSKSQIRQHLILENPQSSLATPLFAYSPLTHSSSKEVSITILILPLGILQSYQLSPISQYSFPNNTVPMIYNSLPVNL